MRAETKYASALDARSTIVQTALLDVGKKDEKLKDGLRTLAEVSDRKTPENWSGPWALCVLIATGLVDWKWRPGIGFCYKLQRIDVDQAKPGDVVYFDRPPKDEIIDAEFVDVDPEALPLGEPKLKSARRGSSTTRRPPSSNGPHTAIIIDVLVTGALRIVKAAHEGAVGILTITAQSVNACYSVRALVDPFDVPAAEPPEPVADLPELVAQSLEASDSQPSDWEDESEAATDPDLPMPSSALEGAASAPAAQRIPTWAELDRHRPVDEPSKEEDEAKLGDTDPSGLAPDKE